MKTIHELARRYRVVECDGVYRIQYLRRFLFLEWWIFVKKCVVIGDDIYCSPEEFCSRGLANRAMSNWIAGDYKEYTGKTKEAWMPVGEGE